MFDIVYCYGLLYHLERPAEAIELMSRCCRKILLLETVVSFGDGESINLCPENTANPTQSISSHGCRPTRKWIYNQLNQLFDFVYMPITQPNHEEFPIDWACLPSAKTNARSIFIASRQSLTNKFLVEEIPMHQIRH